MSLKLLDECQDYLEAAQVFLTSQELSTCGQRVLLLMDSSLRSWGMLLALIQSGHQVVLLSLKEKHAGIPTLPDNTQVAWSVECQAEWCIKQLSHNAKPTQTNLPGVWIKTSGTTGEAKWVFRSEKSLLSEGQRYCDAGLVAAEDRVLCPLSFCHAYALGWLFACMVAGALVNIVPTDNFNAITELMFGWATIVVLTPAVAKLLAMRGLPKDYEGSSPQYLQLAMVGAGPVDEALEVKFSHQFAVGLARNYGSTETGATLHAPAYVPGGVVGHPLPNVTCQTHLEDGGERLRVRVDQSGWVETQDLVTYLPEHGYKVMGRITDSIRRGDKWLAPAELEQVLLGCGDIIDLSIRKVINDAGEEHLCLDIVPKDVAVFRDSDIYSFLASCGRLDWRPDRIQCRYLIHRSVIGKPQKRDRYYLSSPQALLAAAQAYKQSQLLFALRDLGILHLLNDGYSTEEIARQCGIGLAELDLLLDVGQQLGVLSLNGKEPCHLKSVQAYIDLEAELSKKWVTSLQLVEGLRHGVVARPFDAPAETISADMLASYNHAMHGEHTGLRTKLGLRQLNFATVRRVLEISVGKSRYLPHIMARTNGASGYFLPLGKLSLPCHDYLSSDVRVLAVDELKSIGSGYFDICILNNAVHSLSATCDLETILHILAEGGQVLIEDLFYAKDTASIALDWFTHGGLQFLTQQQLERELIRMQLDFRAIDIPTEPYHMFYSITKKEGNYE